MITPITRKELYLAKIIGEDVDIPETAKTREELFFLKILDNSSKIPEPITREELFLAKIAGQDIELPKPKTRLELFLAKAAGMDVEMPVPVTREEIFWSNYSAIVDFEVEGVPPLTYKAIEGTLENYRIYGNTVNGENVGDLITEGEHAGEYSVPVTVTNGTDTETKNIYLPEQIKMVGDEAEYIDYAEQKQYRVRKNLMPNTATNRTINGVTFTVNEDGSITCNGTATNTAEIRLFSSFSLPAGSYRLTGTPSSGSVSYYYLRAWYYSPGTTTVWLIDGGSGYDFTLTDTTTMNSSIVIRPNQVLNHITFYPMIHKADITDDTYEPYIENTDLDVTLPALSTIKGTNVLSVRTAVQPSKVYVKYKGERQ